MLAAEQAFELQMMQVGVQLVEQPLCFRGGVLSLFRGQLDVQPGIFEGSVQLAPAVERVVQGRPFA